MSPHTVTVSKWMRASCAKVFAAWTEPEIMRQWFFPEGMALVFAESDVRVGGKYRAAMRNGDDTYTVHGEYREVVPDTKLVFTHRWEEQDAVQTLVVVDFREQDGGTLVTLTHEGLRSDESARGHELGWQGTFGNLERFLRESPEAA